jgi:hypothetical protein
MIRLHAPRPLYLILEPSRARQSPAHRCWADLSHSSRIEKAPSDCLRRVERRHSLYARLLLLLPRCECRHGTVVDQANIRISRAWTKHVTTRAEFIYFCE